MHAKYRDALVLAVLAGVCVVDRSYVLCVLAGTGAVVITSMFCVC